MTRNRGYVCVRTDSRFRRHHRALLNDGMTTSKDFSILPGPVPCADTRPQVSEAIEMWGGQRPKKSSDFPASPTSCYGAGPGRTAGMHINMTTFAARPHHYIHD